MLPADDRIEEMKANMEYYKTKSEKYAKAINIVIEVTYNTIKPRL